ncbi:hypothetical protein DevBK_20605 [Devosia sp. BK]|uniref:hypothetical protein n=1 Tax=Devosia sp. BK TaxID=2871706 RepID=UPI00293A9E11|nr:hypothetical protein [Devosia sp. BK]MDV3253749.1 hypothetical protein [Devosia sp. BK]
MTTLRKALAATAILTSALLAGTTGFAAAAESQEITNLTHFHLIDFIGWNNNNMDVMRAYHGAEVAVDMAGFHTDGLDAHIAALEGMQNAGTAKIVQHSPNVAQGEWTAVVGFSASSLATIGKWKDGVLTEEHLFLRPLSAEETKSVDMSNPIIVITTPDDAELRAATGAEAGWSATMVDGYAVFTQTLDGKVTQQLGFASK